MKTEYEFVLKEYYSTYQFMQITFARRKFIRYISPQNNEIAFIT